MFFDFIFKIIESITTEFATDKVAQQVILRCKKDNEGNPYMTKGTGLRVFMVLACLLGIVGLGFLLGLEPLGGGISHNKEEDWQSIFLLAGVLVLLVSIAYTTLRYKVTLEPQHIVVRTAFKTRRVSYLTINQGIRLGAPPTAAWQALTLPVYGEKPLKISVKQTRATRHFLQLLMERVGIPLPRAVYMKLVSSDQFGNRR